MKELVLGLGVFAVIVTVLFGDNIKAQFGLASSCPAGVRLFRGHASVDRPTVIGLTSR